MRVEKKPKAFAYRIYSHFTQQCKKTSKVGYICKIAVHTVMTALDLPKNKKR